MRRRWATNWCARARSTPGHGVTARARPRASGAARSRSFVPASGTVRIVEQLHGVPHLGANPGGGEPGAELHETAGIAGGDELGRCLAQILELGLENRA